MKAVTRITFCDDNDEKFFGEGPCRLLHAIEETGSLRSAAISMGLAYTKALRIIKCRSRSRLSTDHTLCWRKIRRWKYTHSTGKGMADKI